MNAAQPFMLMVVQREHAPCNLKGIEAADHEEERQDNEHLDDVRAHHNREVGYKAPQGLLREDAMDKLRGEGEDADGERQDQPVDEDEEDVLNALQEIKDSALVIALRHYGEREAEECRYNQNGEDIPGGERLMKCCM